MVSFWQQAAEIITVSAKTKCSNLWDSMHEQHTVQFKHLPQTFRPELTCRLWCCNNSVTLGSSCQVTVWENEASKKQGCEWQKFWQGRNRRRHHALNLTQVAKFLEVEGNKIHKGTSCYKCNTIDTNTNITNNHEMVTLHNTISWRRLSFFFFFFFSSASTSMLQGETRTSTTPWLGCLMSEARSKCIKEECYGTAESGNNGRYHYMRT